MEKSKSWQDYIFLGLIGITSLIIISIILQNAGFISQ